MRLRQFLIALCLVFAVIAAPTVTAAQEQVVDDDTGEITSSAQAASYRRVIALLEEEIVLLEEEVSLLEADLARVAAAHQAEAGALEQAREEAGSVQARVAELQQTEMAATRRLAELQDVQAC
jgi:chromosome segregation ATPase